MLPADSKVLVIGSNGHAGVTCVSWNEELPNVVDFHVCIVVVSTLDDRIAIAKNHEYFEKLAQLLRRLLLSEGMLIVVGDKFRRIKRPKRYPEEINNYYWCPFNLRFFGESGNTIVSHVNDYSHYLSRLKNWSFHYDCAGVDREWIAMFNREDKIHVVTRRIVENREGRLLAGAHQVAIYYAQKKQSYSGSYTVHPDNPDKVSGPCVFLPPLRNVDTPASVNLLLEDLGIRQQTLAPEWEQAVIIPGVTDTKKIIEAVSEEMQKLEQTLEALEVQRSNQQRYTKLLYETGAELEDIFRESLTVLGGVVTDAKYGKEEYILEWTGQELLVEVKGNTKSISLDDLRQILDYVLRYQKDTGKEGKGILFSNAWRLLPIAERDTKDKPIFPDDVRKAAEKHGIALVSSVAFFDAFCRFLDKKISAQAILDAMKSAGGVVKFPE